MTTNVTVLQYFIDSGWVWWGGEGKLIISRSAFLSQLAERCVVEQTSALITNTQRLDI